MACKIRINDKVIILTGKEKKKIGIVKKILSKSRLIISNINIVKKHQKPIPAMNTPGEIIEKEASIHISNVAILNPNTNKADKIKIKIESGKKIRIFKSSGEVI